MRGQCRRDKLLASGNGGSLPSRNAFRQVLGNARFTAWSAKLSVTGSAHITEAKDSKACDIASIPVVAGELRGKAGGQNRIENRYVWNDVVTSQQLFKIALPILYYREQVTSDPVPAVVGIAI